MSAASHEKYQVEEVSPANSALQPFPVGDFNIPCNWDSDNHNSRNIQPFTLVKLSEKCWEYASIEGEFSKAGAKIMRIDRIENKELWEKFHAESKRMLRSRTAVNEVYLFHGSKGKKEDICHEGLDQRLSRIGHFGRGIYFSNDVRKCFFYTKEKKDHSDEDKQCTVYKCRVLLGIVKVYPKGQNAKDLKREPQLDKPGPLGIKYYDSVQGQISEFEEFIVYKSERVLPEYIITCLPPKSSSSAPLNSSQSLPAFTNNVQSSSSAAATTNGHSNSAPSSPTNSVELDDEEAWELQFLSKSNEQNSKSADETGAGRSSAATGGVKEERSVSVGSEGPDDEEKCDSASEDDEFEIPPEEICDSAGEDDEDLYTADPSVTTNNHHTKPSGASNAPDQDDCSAAAASPMFQTDEEFEKHLLEVRKRVQEKRKAQKDNPSLPSANSEPSAATSQPYQVDPVSPALDDEHHKRLMEVRKRMQEKRKREREGLSVESDDEETTDMTTDIATDVVDSPDHNVNQAIDSLVPQFLEFTGCEDVEEATRYIKHAQMDLNDAIMMYLNAT
ncbi:uncharacterized protein [Amphiura filiformis]|uniref:uncharacterized protein n=1 Tax=Amphiura filiformis TaxID=82378 RepID=UPI003B21B295